MLLRDLVPVDAPAFRLLDDEDPLPADAAHTLVPLARFLDMTDAERRRCGGAALQPDDAIDDLRGDLGHASGGPLAATTRVALAFPSFTDGRGYSQARLLRRHGFTGELLARGDVRLDQLDFMRRCGIDAAELPEPVTAAALASLRSRYETDYQPAYRSA